jgi:hypothetical protein
VSNRLAVEGYGIALRAMRMGRTEHCANRDDLEILTLAGVAIAV